MTHRARSQSVLARHWSPVGVVGAVGRASVGFSLAVGRSQSIRPTVRFGDLNSAALRPSFDVLRRHRGVDDADAGHGPLERRSLDQAGDSTVRAPARRPARPSDASALPAAASRASIERSRRHPKRRAHPTWTDQIINRSSVDATRSTPTSSIAGPPPVAAVPDGFVSSGDAKLDQLRLLASAHEAGATPRDSTAGRQLPGGERPAAAAAAASSGPLRRTTAADPTVAVRADGPGRLARAMRPESAVSPAVPSARLGGPPAPLTTGARSAPASSSSPVRRSTQAQAPSRLDSLRSMLVEQGILDAGSDHVGAPASSSSPTPAGPTGASPRPSTPAGRTASVGRTGPVDPAGPRRPTNLSSDLQRAAGADVRRSTSTPDDSGAQTTRGDSTTTSARTATSPGTDPSPSGVDVAPRPSSEPGLSSASPSPVVQRAVDSTAPGRPAVDQRSAVALAERIADAMTPTPATATRPTATTTTTPTPQTSPTAYTTPTTPTTPTTTTVTGATKQRLRAQRLLRSGLVTDTSASDTFATGETSNQTTADAAMARTMAPTMAPTIEPVRTSASIDTVEARSLPTLSPARRPVLDERLPSLARVDSTPSTLIRRVTLPRALSSTHRPASQLAPVHVRDVPGATRTSGSVASAPVQRASTVSLGDAVASTRVATITQREPNSSGAPWESPTTSAAGPLLQVVRRIAATDVAAAASPYTATTAATTTPTPSEAMNVAGGEALTGARTSRTRRTAASTASSTATAATANSTATAPSTVTAAAANSTAAGAVARSTAAAVAATARAGALAEVMRSVAPGQSDANGGATPDAALPSEPTAQAPAERVADQFMSVLSETIRRRPAPLPTTYRPLADAIAGPRPVMLSTDTASRKALRSVGKVAATTGDTIHLDHQSIPSARLDEVMAHELTHIAHPSPTPRFFDDIDDSPEERRAEQVAKVMARSPLAPSATTSAPPERRRRDTSTIRRSPATSAPSSSSSSSSSGSVSAQALAASLTGGRSPARSDVVQRWEKASPSPSLTSPSSSSSSSSTSSKTAPQIGAHRATKDSNPSAEWFREQLDANLDHVVRLLEDRMIVELERRGGRAWRQS